MLKYFKFDVIKAILPWCILIRITNKGGGSMTEPNVVVYDEKGTPVKIVLGVADSFDDFKKEFKKTTDELSTTIRYLVGYRIVTEIL